MRVLLVVIATVFFTVAHRICGEFAIFPGLPKFRFQTSDCLTAILILKVENGHHKTSDAIDEGNFIF